MKGRINKWIDLLDRAAWTAIQASLGVIAGTSIAHGGIDWTVVGWSCLVATAAALVKVMAAQQIGDSGLGDAVPGATVIEPTAKKKS